MVFLVQVANVPSTGWALEAQHYLPGLCSSSIRQVAIPDGFYTLCFKLPTQVANSAKHRPSLPPSGTSRCASIFVTKVPGLFKVATTSQGASAQHSSDIRGQVGPTAGSVPSSGSSRVTSLPASAFRNSSHASYRSTRRRSSPT